MDEIKLQDALTDAMLIEAWTKVQANAGCAGIDGESLDDFQQNLMRNLVTLRNEINYETYRPLPLLRIHVPKKDAPDKRPLSIPSVRDRVLHTAVALVLTPLFETEFEDCSFAYRKGRSVEQAVQRVTQLRDQGYRWVVDADIDAFFDEIDHEILMSEVEKLVKDPPLLKLLQQWLSADIVDGNKRFRITKGVPQGSPISPLLSNLYLDHLDEAFMGKNIKLVRFADDFLVLCKSRMRAEKALEITEVLLKQLKLEINEEKTRIVDFQSGFRFLGVQFVRSLTLKAKYPQQDSLLAASQYNKNKNSPTTLPNELTTSHKPQKLATNIHSAFTEAGVNDIRFPLSPPETPEDMQPVEQAEELDDTPGTRYDPRLRTLYLTEHGYVLAKESERLIVKHEDKIVKTIHAIKVDQIMIFGNAQITTQTMQFCLRESIPIYLLSAKGRYYGAIDAFDTDPVLLHRDQFIRAADSAFCLSLAKSFVQGKVANCRVLLQRQLRKYETPELAEVVAGLKAIRLQKAETLDQLRGFEGSAARAYFGAIGKLIDPTWQFTGRVRQPPTDPVNALLSYGYTLLFYNIYTFLRARGMNPHVGYLHPMRAGHPALASDLIEEFRAIIVDTVVLNLVLNKKLSPDDFQWPQSSGDGCIIKDKARRIFIQALEAKLNTAIRHPVSSLQLDYRRCIEHQIRHLAAVIRGRESHYQAMVIR